MSDRLPPRFPTLFVQASVFPAEVAAEVLSRADEPWPVLLHLRQEGLTSEVIVHLKGQQAVTLALELAAQLRQREDRAQDEGPADLDWPVLRVLEADGG